MGVTLAAGSSLQWFRNRFCQAEQEIADQRGVDVYQVMDEMAESVQPGSDKLLFLPYLSGERTPHLDPNARGVFFGLSTIHEKAHLIRSVLEGVAFSLNDCLSVLRELNVNAELMMLTGGGAASPLWQKIISDIFDCTMNTCKSNQGPSLGAAILAGVGAGIFTDLVDGCGKVVQLKNTVKPTESDFYQNYYQVYQDIYPALKKQYESLATI